MNNSSSWNPVALYTVRTVKNNDCDKVQWIAVDANMSGPPYRHGKERKYVERCCFNGELTRRPFLVNPKFCHSASTQKHVKRALKQM